MYSLRRQHTDQLAPRLSVAGAWIVNTVDLAFAQPAFADVTRFILGATRLDYDYGQLLSRALLSRWWLVVLAACAASLYLAWPPRKSRRALTFCSWALAGVAAGWQYGLFHIPSSAGQWLCLVPSLAFAAAISSGFIWIPISGGKLASKVADRILP